MSYGKAIVIGGLLAAGALYATKKFLDWAEEQVTKDELSQQQLAERLGTPPSPVDEVKDNG